MNARHPRGRPSWIGQEGAIVALGLVVCMIIIAMAVAEFIHGADHIALTDGNRALYASKGQAA